MTLEEFIRIAALSFTVENLVGSVVGGLAFGFLVLGHTAAMLRFSGQSDYAETTGILAALLGLVFFAPVLAGALSVGDPVWPRVLVRMAFWLLFCVCLVLGIKARVHWKMRRDRKPMPHHHPWHR